MSKKNFIKTTDDKGIEHTHCRFILSNKSNTILGVWNMSKKTMSFLPDGFTYLIQEEEYE